MSAMEAPRHPNLKSRLRFLSSVRSDSLSSNQEDLRDLSPSDQVKASLSRTNGSLRSKAESYVARELPLCDLADSPRLRIRRLRGLERQTPRRPELAQLPELRFDVVRARSAGPLARLAYLGTAYKYLQRIQT